ncbi:MAG: hypothetical protein ACTS4V_01620 [Candidatus Hodgkinia cicadicola]
MSIKPNEVKLTNERNNDGAFNLRKPLPKEVSFPFLEGNGFIESLRDSNKTNKQTNQQIKLKPNQTNQPNNLNNSTSKRETPFGQHERPPFA